jgi:hypothetical protein
MSFNDLGTKNVPPHVDTPAEAEARAQATADVKAKADAKAARAAAQREGKEATPPAAKPPKP